MKFTCTTCDIEFENTEKSKRDHFYRCGRAYCSKECSEKYKKRISRESLIKTNKKYASQRMINRNPSYNPLIVEKIRNTKEKNGTLHNEPIKKGGNGKELPYPVIFLNSFLKWETTYIVPTGCHNYYPTHYKLEIANPEKKIAIEIDGQSSYSRKELAEKKDDYLTRNGWKVIRFKNRDVLNNVNVCLEKIKCLMV